MEDIHVNNSCLVWMP